MSARRACLVLVLAFALTLIGAPASATQDRTVVLASRKRVNR